MRLQHFKMAAKHKVGDESYLPLNKHEKIDKNVVLSPEGHIHYTPSDNLPNTCQFYEQRGNWMAFFHWETWCYYYQDTKTSTTQWEPPKNWDSLPPVYNPWCQNYLTNSCPGEGRTSSVNEHSLSSSASEKEEKLCAYMEKPARRQIEAEKRKKAHWIPEGATEYNIWYDRWVGEHWHGDRGLGPADTRCCLETDAGFTKANILDPHTNKHYFCLYFAKGCCHLGSDCGYLHSIPADKDEQRIGLVQDCFGRDRHHTHKESLGGVGTFEKDCCTLYVGGLSNHSNLEEMLWKEFGEWGKIEVIRIIPKRHIAFVRYKNRVNAEFAKVAMADQKLGNKDVLNVRWANDDPDPKAHKQELRRAKETLLETASERGLLHELAAQPLPLTSNGPTGVYPNTNDQYCSTEYWPYAGDSGQVHSGTEYGPMTKEHIEQAQVLENTVKDCTRLDEALKRIESDHGTCHADNDSVGNADLSNQIQLDNSSSVCTTPFGSSVANDSVNLDSSAMERQYLGQYPKLTECDSGNTGYSTQNRASSKDPYRAIIGSDG